MKTSTEFGYYPKPLDWTVGDIQIRTLPNLSDTADSMSRDAGVERGWIYSPPQRTKDFMSGVVREQPYSARVFGLPKTHVLEHQDSDGDAHLEFLTWALGFIVGMRLTNTEAGFVDATPINPGALHDIVWNGKDSVPNALHFAEQFWKAHSPRPRITKALTGIINSLFLAQTPTLLPFEQFIYLYVALEGCHFVHRSVLGQKPKSGTQKARVADLCQAFGIAVPPWADPGSTSIADHRNETMHEGLFFDEPLGFALYGGTSPIAHSNSVDLEMQMLVCRFLVALLEIPATDYIRSDVNTRSRHGVTI